MPTALTEFQSYSQHGEDRAILPLFDAPGRFLDIGAWDPKALSNTRALYEAGWSGVIIEPSPMPFYSHLREYGHDERITLIHAAIGRDRHCAEFWVTDDAVSTTERDQYDKWKNHAKFIGKFWVPIITLADIFNQFGGGFDFINIDVEGKSVDVLADLLATEALPKCICVEYDDRLDEAKLLARSKGYGEVLVNGTNLVIAR